jgi:hypothetical protein
MFCLLSAIQFLSVFLPIGFLAKQSAYSDHAEHFEPVGQFAASRPPADFVLSVLDRQEKVYHARQLIAAPAGVHVRSGSKCKLAGRLRRFRSYLNMRHSAVLITRQLRADFVAKVVGDPAEQ